MVQIIFLLASLVLAFLSRASLRMPGSHGFYRFFAWEAILGLVLYQLPDWFNEPFSTRQSISWLLLILSGMLAIEGVRLLKKYGQPEESRVEKGLVGVEKTTRLVKTGLYKYIRHPLYSSLLCLTWDALLKDPSRLAWILAGIASVLLYITARVEEQENIRYFGEVYRGYMVDTKMFLPFIF